MNFYTKVGGFLFIYNIVLLFLSDLRVFRVCGVLTCRFFASLLCLLFRWLCRCLGAFRPALIAFLLVLFGIFVIKHKPKKEHETSDSMDVARRLSKHPDGTPQMVEDFDAVHEDL